MTYTLQLYCAPVQVSQSVSFSFSRSRPALPSTGSQYKYTCSEKYGLRSGTLTALV